MSFPFTGPWTSILTAMTSDSRVDKFQNYRCQIWARKWNGIWIRQSDSLGKVTIKRWRKCNVICWNHSQIQMKSFYHENIFSWRFYILCLLICTSSLITKMHIWHEKRSLDFLKWQLKEKLLFTRNENMKLHSKFTEIELSGCKRPGTGVEGSSIPHTQTHTCTDVRPFHDPTKTRLAVTHCSSVDNRTSDNSVDNPAVRALSIIPIRNLFAAIIAKTPFRNFRKALKRLSSPRTSKRSTDAWVSMVALESSETTPSTTTPRNHGCSRACWAVNRCKRYFKILYKKNRYWFWKEGKGKEGERESENTTHAFWINR